MSKARYYDDWLNEQLKNPVSSASYLTACSKDEYGIFLSALKDVIKAHPDCLKAENKKGCCETTEAITELEAGKCKRFDSVDSLMVDLHLNDIATSGQLTNDRTQYVGSCHRCGIDDFCHCFKTESEGAKSGCCGDNESCEECEMAEVDPVVVAAQQVIDVHTEHCCKTCGCKYGDRDCHVVSGFKKQSHKCGSNTVCGSDDYCFMCGDEGCNGICGDDL